MLARIIVVIEAYVAYYVPCSGCESHNVLNKSSWHLPQELASSGSRPSVNLKLHLPQTTGMLNPCLKELWKMEENKELLSEPLQIYSGAIGSYQNSRRK